jgi:hypothetical protein
LRALSGIALVMSRLMKLAPSRVFIRNRVVRSFQGLVRREGHRCRWSR